jgi:hypothetical protein
MGKYNFWKLAAKGQIFDFILSDVLFVQISPYRHYQECCC